MTCGECGARDAVVSLTQVVNGEARTVGLCERCASEKGIQTSGQIEQTPLGGFLTALWQGAELPVDQGLPGRCPGCGTAFADFKESGHLGCAVCWTTFAPALGLLVRRYHGASRHRGRRHAGPVASTVVAEGDELVAILRAQLQAAIAAEEFERAAELRDRLREVT